MPHWHGWGIERLIQSLNEKAVPIGYNYLIKKAGCILHSGFLIRYELFIFIYYFYIIYP